MASFFMKYLVYLTYPAMLVLLFFGAKFSKKGEWNDEFMNYDQTKYLQGYLAICIMLHHIGQEMCASWQRYKLYPGLEFFVPLGYLFVGVFFMCSGYGLYLSVSNKSDYLAKGFFRRRVLPLLLGYYVSAWIFFIARIIMKQKMNPWDIFCYLSGIKLSNPYGWFAIIMPLFYLFFYIAFKCFKKRQILVVAILVLLYTFIGTCIDHNDYLITGQWWWNCVQLFWVGMLLAKYKDKVVARAKKGYILKLLLCVVLFFVCWLLSQWTQGVFSYYGENMRLPRVQIVYRRWICLVFEILCSSLFSFLLLLAGLKVKLGNKFLGFMGTITFEFYIIHGLVVEFFSFKFCDVVKPIVRITNVALMIVVVLAGGIPLALLMKKICHCFDKKRADKSVCG